MVTYNREQYIDTALRSVLRQKTNFRFEIIICEDCSTDNTLSICERYAKEYPETIRLLVNENNLGYQRNNLKCLAAAKGKYIAVCDPDDYWLSKNKLQIQFDIMERSPKISLCFHRVLNYYENDNSKSLSNGTEKAGFYTLEELSKRNFISNVSCFFRNHFFEIPEGIEAITSVDYVFSMLCAAKGDLLYIPKVMAVYRKSDSSIFVGKDRAKGLIMSLNVRKFLIQLFPNNPAVVANLKAASAAILYNIWRLYDSQNDENQATLNYNELQTEHSEWLSKKLLSEDRISMAQRVRSTTKKTLTYIRKTLSRLYPLPQIK